MMTKSGEQNMRETDLIIPIIGVTGVGKSSFINTVAGDAATKVGHDLELCTKTIQSVIVSYPGDPTRRVVFLDTPGFDVDEAEVLRLISAWLANSYIKGKKLAGIIYLHDIYQARFHATPHKNLVFFDTLCGDRAPKHIILATTKWKNIKEGIGRRREQQLSEVHWKKMLDQGSQMVRFEDTNDSARAIVSAILKTRQVDESTNSPSATPSRKMTRKPRTIKDAKASDIINRIPNPQPTDVIIPVMGSTGVGKSTFINIAVGANVTRVGNDLESCTSTVLPVIVPYPGDPNRRVIFVDTPGFGDTYIDDAEILRRIAVWLAHSYNEGMKIAGVIYLHEISQARMVGTSRRNFLVFNRMSGNKAAKDVVLATTKWSHIMEDVGRRREEQLRETHWKNMLDHGSHMTRFLKTSQSAWGIVDIILKTGAIDALLIQDELVNLQKRIPMTEAGTSLRNALQELLKEQKEMVEKLKKKSRENGELRERYEESMERLRLTLNQIQDLKVPLGARIKYYFATRQGGP